LAKSMKLLVDEELCGNCTDRGRGGREQAFGESRRAGQLIKVMPHILHLSPRSLGTKILYYYNGAILTVVAWNLQTHTGTSSELVAELHNK
jgi:hypothetical protein